jgi:hypothetical protein
VSNIPRPPRREPEWVGPDTTREDMTGRTERQLALRAVHEALLTRQAVEMMVRSHATLEKRVEGAEGHIRHVDARVVALEEWRRHGSVPPEDMREKEISIHDFDPAIARFRQGAKKAESSKDNPLTGPELAAIVGVEVDKALTKIGEAGELSTYRRIKVWLMTGIGQAVSWGWKAAVFGALGWLAHHLFAR